MTQPHMEIRWSRNANTVTHVAAVTLVLQFGIRGEICMQGRYYGILHVLHYCKHAMPFTLALMYRATGGADWHMRGDGAYTLIQQSREIQPFITNLKH